MTLPEPHASIAWRWYLRGQYRLIRLLDPFVATVWRGYGLGNVVQLQVRGRRTGRPRPILLGLLQDGEHWFLGHPNGDVAWTRNLEAAESPALSFRYPTAVPIRAMRLPPGELRDRAILLTGQHVFPGNVIYRLARAHVRAVGVYFSIEIAQASIAMPAQRAASSQPVRTRSSEVDTAAMDRSSNERTNQANEPDTRAEVDPDVAELLGLRPADADSIPGVDELDEGDGLSDTRLDEGAVGSRVRVRGDGLEVESLESLTSSEVRAGETDDPEEAAEEGLAWIPPTDPPIRPGPDGEPEVAAGFGTSAADEPFDRDHHGDLLDEGTDERTARVLEALRADAATSGLADRLSVEMDGGRVVISGTVDDLEDEDAVTAVAEDVPGVTEVVSRLEITSLEATDERP